MFRRFSVNFAVLAIFADAVSIAFSLAVADFVRPSLSNLPFVAELYELSVPVHLYPFIIIAWISIMFLLSIYDGRRNLYIVDELTNLTVGTMIAGVSIAGMLYLSYRDISRVLFLIFVFFTHIIQLGPFLFPSPRLVPVS